MTPLTDKIVTGLVFTLLLQFPSENTNSHEGKVDRVEENQLIRPKKWEVYWEMNFHIDLSYFF